MNIVGERIKHKIFGTGTCLSQTDKGIVVKFPAGEKAFQFPKHSTNFCRLKMMN